MTGAGSRIYLSPPDAGGAEREALLRALDSNWLAPLGPEVDAFEREVAEVAGRRYGAATSSGTAALHLALRLVGVGPGSEVLLPTLTFVATANAAAYLGAQPVFVDVDTTSWTIDCDLLAEELDHCASGGRLPGAVIAVDLYGQCADYDRLTDLCASLGVPLILDSAEALGATYKGRPSGSSGSLAIFSFNGNKIITTSGGGMLVGDDPEVIAHARSLTSQARLPVAHYQHEELGYNYRLSNLLAALGRAQLATLAQRVARRTEVNRAYRDQLSDLPGVSFQAECELGTSSNWMTVMLLEPEEVAMSPGEVMTRLEAFDIETRPGWMPLHLQPLYADARRRGGEVSEAVYSRSLCLPSGSSLTPADQERVVDHIRDLLRGPPSGHRPKGAPPPAQRGAIAPSR